MRKRLVFVLVAGMGLGFAAAAQDAGTPPAGGQGPAGQSPAGPMQGGVMQGGQRGGRGWGGMMGGRGMMGTVVEAAADHFTIKLDSGETRTVNFSANTRIMKQPPRSSGGDGVRTPPEPIKATDIKVGDAIAASGELDGSGKSVGAMLIVQLDPEHAKQMREMQANFGKTWLIGKVVSIHETKITLRSPIDNAMHTFVADENTTFRKRRDFITLADLQVGDNMRIEGAVKEGAFMATSVNVMAMPPATGAPIKPQDKAPQ